MSDVNFEASVRYRRGAELHDLMDELIAAGFPTEAVEDAVMRVHRRVVGDDRRRGINNLILGLVAFVGCAGLAIWTRMKGMSFPAAWAGVVAGGSWALVGVRQIARAGKDRGLARISALGA